MSEPATQLLPKTPLKKRRQRIRILVIGVVFIFVLAALFSIELHNLNSSSTGKVYTPSLVTQTAGLNFDFKPVAVTGQYISFSYPAAFKVDADKQPPKPPIIESYLYKYNGDIQSWLLSITVTKLLADNLSADSSYYMRSLNPNEYSQPPTYYLAWRQKP